MIIAALIVGVTVGLICGVVICMLQTQSEIETLEVKVETQEEKSVPKIAVIKALNGSRMDPTPYRQNRKDNPAIYWNGAVEAVRFQLEDYLK